jgi:hypothetical protein
VKAAPPLSPNPTPRDDRTQSLPFIDYNDTTCPDIDSASIRLALGLAAKHELEIAILDIPTAFSGCPRHDTVYMHLPDCEWPDPSGRSRHLVQVIKTWYGIKQTNLEYCEEVFDSIVDNLSLQGSIATASLIFGANLAKANRILIQV